MLEKIDHIKYQILKHIYIYILTVSNSYRHTYFSLLLQKAVFLKLDKNADICLKIKNKVHLIICLSNEKILQNL